MKISAISPHMTMKFCMYDMYDIDSKLNLLAREYIGHLDVKDTLKDPAN